MGYIRGTSFVLLWYTSIIWSVIFVYTPLLLVLLVNRRWFRKITDIVLSCWEMYPAALLEILMGCKICISGVDINPDEGSIIIMNHRNRLDWFFLWAALLHGAKPPAHRCKFVLKSDVRWLPGIGWGLQLAGFLFIYRDWVRDQILLTRSLDYFRDLDQKYQILIFPEGTNFAKDTKEKSDAFAKKSGLKPYDYVLHPRTTGFAFLVSHMKKNHQIDSVYDLTVGYPKTLPRNETDILRGRIPEEVHFHIERHAAKDIPSDEPSIKKWCENRWAEKELSLKAFYNQQREDKKFSENSRCERHWNAMYLALVGWTVVTIYTLYYTFATTWGFYWFLFCFIGFVAVSGLTTGIQQIEIDLFRKYDYPENVGMKMHGEGKVNGSINCKND